MLWSDNGSGTTFEQPPAGTHVARCVRLIDLGTQKNDYQGEISYKRQVWVAWELPTELQTEGEFAGQPFLVSSFYTQSLHPKSKLRKDLAAWRGRDFTEDELKGFDAKSILGAPCLLSIIIAETGRARVNGVMQLPKGTKVPAQVSESVFFSLESSDFDLDSFEHLSKGIKAIVERSPEYQAHAQRDNGFTTPGQAEAKAAEKVAVPADAPADEVDEDDIPF